MIPTVNKQDHDQYQLNMPRFYLRLILIPTALFTIVLILIHAQPYDDHELRELLLPEGCPAPCFMGIRPEVTTMDEALQILRANDLVKDVQSYATVIGWKWNNVKSIWNDSRGGKIIAKSDSQLVDTIILYTNISIGEVQLTLGSPDMEIVGIPQGNANPYVGYVGIYQQYGLGMQTEVSCKNAEPFKSPPIIMISESVSNTPLHLNSVNDIFRVC